MARIVRAPSPRAVLGALAALVVASSPARAQFEGCTWERCAAQVVAAPFGTRVAFGADTIRLGWRGSDVAARLSRAGDAAPHAARMVGFRTHGVPLSIAGSVAAPFVLAALVPSRSIIDDGERDGLQSRVLPALLGLSLVTGLADIEMYRAEGELHRAVWRHNRQLAQALRRTAPDSLAGELRGCSIERCGVRVRHRGTLAGVRLVQGDAGLQVDLNPFNARAVMPLFRGSAEATRDAERWAARGRTATVLTIGTVVAGAAYLFLPDVPRAQRLWGSFGIAVVGGAITTPIALDADRALQRAIWRVNGELAR